MTEQDRVWVEIKDENTQETTFVLGTCDLHSSPPFHVDLDDGTTRHVESSTVCRANRSCVVERSSDLTSLSYLEEPNILHALEHRYRKKEVYTSVASILIAVNPYEMLPLYRNEDLLAYRRRPGSSARAVDRLNPHIYAVGEEAFRQLSRPPASGEKHMNQSMIVCGESGAGKTENAKQVMRYLANRSHELDSPIGCIEEQIIATNGVLEAFGNAATVLNHNSSRFGKFTKMHFDGPYVRGASTETYLLERSRVVLQNPGERNFHALYQLFYLEEATRSDLGLAETDSFRYLGEGRPEERDRQGLAALKHGLDLIKVTVSDSELLFRVLAGILFLGNISFIPDPDSQEDACTLDPTASAPLSRAASLLGIAPTQMESLLLTREIRLPGEMICKRLTTADAEVQRDALAKSVYAGVFTWVVNRVNAALEQDVQLPWIGILDVFGFECFSTNSLEQFLINYANERLQSHFNDSIIIAEQAEYARESIFWTPVEEPDGDAVIRLIETPWTGILPLLDSACRNKGATPEFLLESILQHTKESHLVRPIDARQRLQHASQLRFTLVHYAGPVEYTLDGFMPKNKDRASDQIRAALVNHALFAVPSVDTATVSSGFSKQLRSLLDTLQSTRSHFVRCIKPNQEAKPGFFDRSHVQPQLKCGGLVQAVQVLKRGFPARVSYETLRKQFGPLLGQPDRIALLGPRQLCRAFLAVFGLQEGVEYQLGLTKAFFLADQRETLDSILSIDHTLSQEQQESFFQFLARQRWWRLRAIIRSSTLVWRSIQRERIREQFRHGVRIAIVVARTFACRLASVHRRVKTRHCVSLQALLRCRPEQQTVAALRLQREAERAAEVSRRKEETLQQERQRAAEVRVREKARVLGEQRRAAKEEAERKKREEEKRRAEEVAMRQREVDLLREQRMELGAAQQEHYTVTSLLRLELFLRKGTRLPSVKEENIGARLRSLLGDAAAHGGYVDESIQQSQGRILVDVAARLAPGAPLSLSDGHTRNEQQFRMVAHFLCPSIPDHASRDVLDILDAVLPPLEPAVASTIPDERMEALQEHVQELEGVIEKLCTELAREKSQVNRLSLMNRRLLEEITGDRTVKLDKKRGSIRRKSIKEDDPKSNAIIYNEQAHIPSGRRSSLVGKVKSVFGSQAKQASQ